MAKPKRKAKQRPQIEAIEAFETPTPIQLVNGDYELGRTPHPEGGNRVAPTYINRGGTPVMRWINSGKLSDTQLIAISLCYRLWGMTGMVQRITASYGERMPASVTFSEARATAELEARQDLYRLQSYVPFAYWQIFENVCRFDEPAGVAGSRLGQSNRSNEDRAHTVVCFVADTIAMKERLIPTTRIRVA